MEEHDWDAESVAKVAHPPRNGYKPTESCAAKGKARRLGTSRVRIKR
jgi:hypothetical protein